MRKQRLRRARFVGGGCLLLWGTGVVGACERRDGSSLEGIGVSERALGTAGGAQACVIGTTSLRLASRVTTSGGIATNSLAMEPGAVVNGDATINNVGSASVLIAGATINGNVRLAGAAP